MGHHIPDAPKNAHSGSPAAKRSERRSWRYARAPWLLLGVCLATGAYALLGFFLVPELVRFGATRFVENNYHRTLSLGEVRVNPFLLTLELKRISLPDRDGSDTKESILSAERIFLDFEALWSIWERAYVLQDLTVERPHILAVARKGGEINLEDLILESEPEDGANDLPALWIKALTLQQGTIDFVDLARRTVFSQRLAPLSFLLKNFRTTPRGGDFRLTAKGEHGASFSWAGKVALSPHLESVGNVAISGLQVTSIAEYLGDALPFLMPTGRVELKASYRMRLRDEPEAHVHLSQVHVSDTSLRARGERTSWIEIPNVSVSDAMLNLREKRLDVAKVRMSGVKARAELQSNKTLNLERLFSLQARPGAAPKTLEPIKRAIDKPDWDVQVAQVELENARMELQDQAIAKSTQFTLEQIHAEVREVSLDLTKAVAVSFSAQVNGDAGELKAEGSVVPSPFSSQLAVAVHNLDLSLGQPYLAPYAALTVRHGTLGGKGTVTLAKSLDFKGDLSIYDLDTVDNALRQPLLQMKQLELQHIHYTQEPNSLEIERIVVRKPYAKLVLSSARVFNLSEVFSPTQDEPAMGEGKPKPTQKQPQKPASEPQASDMAIRIGLVTFEGMRLNFSDFNIQPNFAAEITKLAGSVQGLSSDARSQAKLKLKGKLGDNSPVVISGKLQPFEFEKFTDISIECENIALPVFNPYSGRFAGYNITRGELSTNLRYRVHNKQLTAEHHIRLDQLTWGEKTETKEKAPLPVKLATALLRDRDGVISLDVPVKGTLDDPNFRLGPIVWQVVKNIVVKAATAPFDLLGSLFKGAEKARYVSFAPGDDKLDAGAREGLAALGKGMKDRPDLQLDVPVGSVSELDTEAVRTRKFEEGLEKSVAESLSRREKRNGIPDYAALDPEQKVDVLENLHKALTGKTPPLPNPPKTPEGTSRKNAKVMQRQFQAEKLSEEVRKKVPVEKSELDALGQRRGEAIETALLEASQIETSRVFLSSKGKVSRDGERVRFELQIK